MEVPILLAVDTTENWENGDTTLGESELAIEIAKEESGTKRKYLLIGDGQPVGPNAKRLRATPELIAGLAEGLRDLAAAIQAEIERAQAAEQVLDEAISKEIERAKAAEKELDEAKINKSIAGEQKTLVRALKVKEITSSSFMMAYENVNVENGNVTETEFELPRVTETAAGLMTPESYNQIGELTRRIEKLEGRARHYPVELLSEFPSQDELQAAYEEVSGKERAPPDMTTLDDLAFNKSYTYYETTGEWAYRGVTTVTQFSNESHGIIKGSDLEDCLSAEPDGTGRVKSIAPLRERVNKIEQAENPGGSQIEIATAAKLGGVRSDDRGGNIAVHPETGIQSLNGWDWIVEQLGALWGYASEGGFNPPPTPPPTVNAGVDQTIALPVTSVTLKGEAESERGYIVATVWERISGPGTAAITNPGQAITTVTGLAAGTHTFKFTATDNFGQSNVATVTVAVEYGVVTVSAGSNATVILPNGAILSGTASSPNGEIATWLWERVSGSGTIASPNSPSAAVSGFTAGASVFKLTVTDSVGKTASAQVTLTAKEALERVTATALATSRSRVIATSIGNSYAIYAGGLGVSGVLASVEVYNAALTRSTATSLSAARYSGCGVSLAGSYGLIAGGNISTTGNGISTVVDAYDTALTRTTPTALSLAATIGPCTPVGSSYALITLNNGTTINAYNTALTRSTPTEASQTKSSGVGVSVGSYGLLAGGANSVVDAYDTALTRKTITALSRVRRLGAATKAGTYGVIGGGIMTSTTGATGAGYQLSVVDAYDTALTRTTPTTLSMAVYKLGAAKAGDMAIFAGGGYDYEKQDDSGFTDVDNVNAYSASLVRYTSSLSKAYAPAAAHAGNYAVFVMSSINENSVDAFLSN